MNTYLVNKNNEFFKFHSIVDKIRAGTATVDIFER